MALQWSIRQILERCCLCVPARRSRSESSCLRIFYLLQMLAPGALLNMLRIRDALWLHKCEVCPDPIAIQLSNLFSERNCIAKLNLSPESDFCL